MWTPSSTARRRAPGGDPADTDGGFVLLESIVSISILSIIMAALTVFTIAMTQQTAYGRQRQNAVRIAQTAMEQARSRTNTDLYLGRTASDTTSYWNAAPAAVKPWLTPMDQLSDPMATTSNPTLPWTAGTTVDNTPYTATTYLGTCNVTRSSSSGAACTNAATAGSDSVAYVRTVVAVTWPGSRCPGNVCAFTTATLMNSTADQTFSVNERGPAVPIIDTSDNPLNSVTGNAYSYQFKLKPGTGTEPITWSYTGTLPTGLSMDQYGKISGTPVTKQTGLSITVTAVDAYNRKTSSTFTVNAYSPVAVTDPGSQTSTQGSAITPLTLAATEGSGSPYTWTSPDSSVPPGLTLSSAGQVTGTPSTVGVYTVTVKAVDSGGQDVAGRSATRSFKWVVSYAPISASQQNLTHTRAAAITPIQLTASGGSGKYTWSDPDGTLPAGISVSSAGKLTGTPTKSGSYSVSLLVTDAVTGLTAPPAVRQMFTWTVVDPPSVSGVATLATTAGASMTADPSGNPPARSADAVAYQCPTASCRLTLTGAPSGIGMATSVSGTAASNLPSSLDVTATSGTVYLGGTIPGNATQKAYSLVVTPVDTSTASQTQTTGTTSTGTWTVQAPPAVTNLAASTVTYQGGTVNKSFTWSCPTTSCVVSVSGAPAGLGVNKPGGTAGSSFTTSDASGTGYLTGTVSTSAAVKVYSVTVTPVDAAGITGTAQTISVDVRAASCATAYSDAVTSDKPYLWYRLGDSSGTTAADSGSNKANGTYAGSVTLGQTGPFVCDPNTSAYFGGNVNNVSSTVTPSGSAISGPNTFTLEVWFRTTTTTGGKLVGFGSSTTGNSGNYDRHLYMGNNGLVYFGVYPGKVVTLVSTKALNDGAWHQAVATLSSAGMVLYIDGSQVATNTSVTSGEGSKGYWRVGYDNINGWTGSPSTFEFKGNLDEVSVYGTALTAARVAAHYNADIK